MVHFIKLLVKNKLKWCSHKWCKIKQWKNSAIYYTCTKKGSLILFTSKTFLFCFNKTVLWKCRSTFNITDIYYEHVLFVYNLYWYVHFQFLKLWWYIFIGTVHKKERRLYHWLEEMVWNCDVIKAFETCCTFLIKCKVKFWEANLIEF